MDFDLNLTPCRKVYVKFTAEAEGKAETGGNLHSLGFGRNPQTRHPPRV